MSTQFDDETIRLRNGADEQLSSERAPYFIVIAGPETGKLHKLQPVETIVGRNADAGIRVLDPGVSRAHAKVVRGTDGLVSIVDLGSRNGTKVNGKRVDTRVLADGDKIKVGGTTVLMFSIQDDLEASFHTKQYDRATKDPLAHCHSRQYLDERLPSDVAFVRRHGQSLTLVMADIDHFKEVNDTHGHLAGDEVLRKVAHLVQESIRSDDVLTRYGGDELLVIMRNTTVAAARVAAERIRQHVAGAAVEHEGKRINVTLSIGIATCTQDQLTSPEELLAAADQMLYRAKNAGRNCVES
jgi:two-component system, cell cycle response regulator